VTDYDQPDDGADHPAVVPSAAARRDERDPQRDQLRRARRAVVDEEFSAFYRATIRRLVGFLINHGAALPVAADIAQDTMFKAYRCWTELNQPSAWVHTVASRALARRIADVREDPVAEVPEPTSLLPRPEAAAEWETRHDVLGMLRSLPWRQRQVLAWTLDGYSPSEIAEELGLSPEAVRSSLRKARRAAVRYLGEGEEDQ
jgi:RNA polymerase sigma factor (sigma-70 family)